MVSDTVRRRNQGSHEDRLNPCSNGIWSLTLVEIRGVLGAGCLNPCSNGIWSLTGGSCPRVVQSGSLNPCSNGIWSLTDSCHAG